MHIAYFDCYSGISGDMTIGALLDAGLELSVLSSQLKKLGLKGYELKASKVTRGPIAGTKFDCRIASGRRTHRSYRDIEGLIDKSAFSKNVKHAAKSILSVIGIAEARVHGLKSEREVAFHEIGAIDSIVDIVGTAVALDALGIEGVRASPVNEGRGFARTAHGMIPIPSPATAEILKGVPMKIVEAGAELVTPTGAGILKALCKSFGPMPQMTVSAIGYGAGSRELKEMPNMLRVFIGDEAKVFDEDTIAVIETNIDDMNPQNFEYIFERLFKAGARDVYTTNIMMKKSRPAFKLTVLADPQLVKDIAGVILSETTSIGLRYYHTQRYKIERKIVKTKTKYGTLSVKVSKGPDATVTISPEYDDCVKAARANRVPLKTVIEAARSAVKVFCLMFLTLYAVRCTLYAHDAFADTIYKKDGTELKGIVVEDFRDRLTFSTVDGEISVMKEDIGEIAFDSEEDNLIKLAEQARERSDFVTAYAYYDKAAKLNPLSKVARDGMIFVQGLLFKKDEQQKEAVVAMQEEFERTGGAIVEEKSEKEKLSQAKAAMMEKYGLVLLIKATDPEVADVLSESPAEAAGIRKSDKLIAVWGRLTGYMPLKDVLSLFLDKSSMEVKCTVERDVEVAVRDTASPFVNSILLIDAMLSMQFDGLTIGFVSEGGTAQKAGLAKDDLIVAVNGKGTRYMPLKRAMQEIQVMKGRVLPLTIRREVTIWGRGER